MISNDQLFTILYFALHNLKEIQGNDIFSQQQQIITLMKQIGIQSVSQLALTIFSEFQTAEFF